MKTKLFFVFFLLILLTNKLPKKIYAEEKASDTSAAFTEPFVSKGTDDRAKILAQFLDKYDSPLAKSAQAFVSEADKNNIDWKLLPAIAGVESTFAHAEPARCNNSWGYNIYGNTIRCFDTYDSAIAVISQDLRQTYINKWGASDVYDIGHYYAASPTWAYKVNHFMNEIADYQFEEESKVLPISL